MKLRELMLLGALTVLLAGCAESGLPSTSTPSAPTPTPANIPIKVYPATDVPRHFIVVGEISGPSMQDLKDKARKLGADAIIAPRKKDPVSGWANTVAIRLTK